MSVSGDDDRLNLLLADADDFRPVLDDGLPGEATQRGLKPTKTTGSKDPHHLRRDGENQNDLKLQRWGIIVPDRPDSDRLIEAIQPLIRLREEEQEAKADIYRVPPEMTDSEAVDWMEKVYWSEDVEEDDRPLYLLMLGDLHEMPAELQHTLANAALVGRIHFANGAGEADLHGYAAYAEKVVSYARKGTAFSAPDMAFFVAQDGTAATHTGEVKLVRPSLEASERLRAKGKLPAAEVRELAAETVDQLLAAGAGDRPSVLLSMSHGMGPPRRGFRTKEEQRQRQGALILDRDEVLDAERLLGERFLPGGMWFCLACYGAGTPSVSAYHAWLSQLAAEGAWSGKAESVLKSLPADGQRPFIAAMPQAALRNPAGPLGVIGHLDLAWTYAFSSAKSSSESRKLRILKALQPLVRGDRAGVGLNGLLQFYRETNAALMRTYQAEADARVSGRKDPTDLIDRGHLWMLRNDLRGYVLLGDPAARLPLEQLALTPKTKAPEPEARASEGMAEVRSDRAEPQAGRAAENPSKGETGASLAVTEKEAFVLAMLHGDETPRSIATRAGVSLEVLWSWIDAYRAGGRARLSE
jgi:hypothetical protein